VLYVCGVHPLIKTPWNIIRLAHPGIARRFDLINDKKDVLTMIESESDIPEWWDDRSAPDDATDYRHQWGDWKRCMQKGQATLTAREVFNPQGVWQPSEQPAKESVKPVPEQHTLGIIDEEEDGAPLI
jgi:hypothetical protein